MDNITAYPAKVNANTALPVYTDDVADFRIPLGNTPTAKDFERRIAEAWGESAQSYIHIGQLVFWADEVLDKT